GAGIGTYNGGMKLPIPVPPSVQKMLDRANDFGFEKTRRSVAALSLSFFVTLYLILSFNAPPGWGPAFLALSACYFVAFMGVVAGGSGGGGLARGLGGWGRRLGARCWWRAGWRRRWVSSGGLH